MARPAREGSLCGSLDSCKHWSLESTWPAMELLGHEMGLSGSFGLYVQTWWGTILPPHACPLPLLPFLEELVGSGLVRLVFSVPDCCPSNLYHIHAYKWSQNKYRFCMKSLFSLFNYFEVRPHLVAQADLGLSTLLPQPSKCFDFRQRPPFCPWDTLNVLKYLLEQGAYKEEKSW